ncbi:Mss4-like protein [Rhypophila decipiens]|uniref:Mss4-like protein n=1 Tax=Rhypophila decipiens TaxID=261697 RepID=A0AAN7B7M4_9PEZI|nr:Mss4-like protein [Rhypophila decipiens]
MIASLDELTFPTPKSITGGCLCGGIRYKVDFPVDHDFKKASGSCQCTQCRRQTGSLFFLAHTIKPASKSSSSSNEIPSTLKEYIINPASPIGARGICTNCGSFMYWRPKSNNPPDKAEEEEEEDYLELAVGTIDPEYLFGEGQEEHEGYGLALVNGGGGHSWCKNSIRGVTDGISWLGADGRGTRKEEH